MPLPFDPFSIDLPIREEIPSVRRYLATGNALILSAPPGAGKSTLLPLALLDEPWMNGKKIVLLEPRRLAASSIAHRMASLIAGKTGETVGYRIRFENQTSARTRIEVVTEGILTRMLHHDNALEDVGLVIFDEFHERRLHTEISMMLCRESQQILRPDLRLLIMSATMDVSRLAALMGAPVVQSEGRQYPVKHVYTHDADIRQIAEETAMTIMQASKEQEGDILAFLPGEAEIRKCESMLLQRAAGFAVHPLYGQLSHQQQQAAIRPDTSGKRKIVLATSIAETSLTIAGISVVVDCGYTRTMTFDPSSGLSRLKTVRISRDAADQRAGRAGRLGPGVCYRMWGMATHQRMAEYRKPEILEADLTGMVLDLARWGIKDIQGQQWLTPPPPGTLAQGMDILEALNALQNGRITPHGKQLHAFPCHPRIAHLLLQSKTLPDRSAKSLATDIAALLEERDPLGQDSGMDINLRLEALRKHRQHRNQGKRFDNIEKIALSYRKLMDIQEDNRPVDPYLSGLLLAYAYPERIAQAVPGNNGIFRLANGRRAQANIADDMAHEAWLAIAQLNARDGMGKIFLAAPLHTDHLPQFAKHTERIHWDTKKGGIVATVEQHIGSALIASKPIRSPEEDKLLKAVCQAVRTEGQQLLDFNEQVVQWQNRVLSLRHWRPGENWPDVHTDKLLQSPENWLSLYLQGIRKVEDLRRINLLEALQHSLGFDQQQHLASLAPPSMQMPSGSTVKLRYSAHGEAPVLAVRLQELFGMLDTPCVNRGHTPVVVHLLSPGYKPVQVTTDLRSFWQNTYFEVRKELKRRYPKHSWPEDPLQAKAVRGVQRRSP